MQPLQYDLRCPAAKDNSITHTAAAPSNLHAAMMTARSAITALQIKLQLRRPPLQSTRSKMDAAITLLGATQDHQTHWHSAVNDLIA